MKKFAKIAIVAVVLCAVVLSFASCSFFTPSFDEMCANLADENYVCVYNLSGEETADYAETLESKYGCELKGEVLARAEYTTGSGFIRLYEFEKRSDAMTAQKELMEDFTSTPQYGTGASLYRYYYVVNGILLETSSTSAAEAALDDAYVLVDMPNATTEDIMDYFKGLFD